jgi:hypothetical protein
VSKYRNRLCWFRTLVCHSEAKCDASGGRQDTKSRKGSRICTVQWVGKGHKISVCSCVPAQLAAASSSAHNLQKDSSVQCCHIVHTSALSRAWTAASAKNVGTKRWVSFSFSYPYINKKLSWMPREIRKNVGCKPWRRYKTRKIRLSEKIIVKRTVQKQGRRKWFGFIWLRVEISSNY